MSTRQHIGVQFFDELAVERVIVAAEAYAGFHIEVECFK
jgi:hypothetical protein